MDLCIGQWNWHITSNFSEVSNLTSCCGIIDMLGICESFLTQDSFLPSYTFPRYQLVSKSRNSMMLGGLAFIIKDQIRYIVKKDLN